jgi:hypothetical protein
MVVGFTTTYAIGAYHHWCCGCDSRWGRGVHYVIKFVSDLQQVTGLLPDLWVYDSRFTFTNYIIEMCTIVIIYYDLLVYYQRLVWFGFMVFNATFNNISVISWQWVLLVEESGGPGEDQWPAASHWLTLSHNVVSSTPRHERHSNSQL